MTKDEIDASGAPHSCIRSTSPPSKEVAPTAVELLQLADQQAYMRARYNEEDSGLIRESRVIEWALRQVATPAAGIREALEKLTGAMRFILAFYEPGQRHLDTEAWKVAEAGARAAFAKAEAALQSVQPPDVAGEAMAIAWMNRDHVDAYRAGKPDGIAWASPTESEFYTIPLYTTRPPSDREAVARNLVNNDPNYCCNHMPGDEPRPVAFPSGWVSKTRPLSEDAAERVRVRADAILSLVNPQDAALSSTTAERGAADPVPRWSSDELALAFFDYSACVKTRCTFDKTNPCPCATEAYKAVHWIKHVLPRSLPLTDSALSSATAGREWRTDFENAPSPCIGWCAPPSGDVVRQIWHDPYQKGEWSAHGVTQTVKAWQPLPEISGSHP